MLTPTPSPVERKKAQSRSRSKTHYNKSKGSPAFLAKRNAQRRESRRNSKESERQVLFPLVAPSTDVLGFTERVSGKTTDVLSKLTDLQNNAVSTYKSTYTNTLQVEQPSANAPTAGVESTWQEVLPSELDAKPTAEPAVTAREHAGKRNLEFVEERSSKRVKTANQSSPLALQSILKKLEKKSQSVKFDESVHHVERVAKWKEPPQSLDTMSKKIRSLQSDLSREQEKVMQLRMELQLRDAGLGKDELSLRKEYEHVLLKNKWLSDKLERNEHLLKPQLHALRAENKRMVEDKFYLQQMKAENCRLNRAIERLHLENRGLGRSKVSASY